MALASDPIAVAASTAARFHLAREVDKVSLAVVFYSTEAAEAGDEVAIGSGTRDIAVSRVSHADGDAGTLTMPISGATASTLAARTFKAFDLGTKTGEISVVASGGADPGGATHYRIWAE